MLSPRQQFAERKKNLRNTALSLAYTLFKGQPISREENLMPRWQLNMQRLDKWLADRGAVKKKVDEMTLKELNLTVTQLRQVIKDLNEKWYQ